MTPTGEIRDSQGTPCDFRTPRTITPDAPPLDTCFCLAPNRRPLTEALTLTGKTGVPLTVATTEPGIQVCDDRPGCHGLAIERQG